MVIQASEKIWKEFIKIYDPKKIFSDKPDIFEVDLSEFGLKPRKIFIYYDRSYSNAALQIGVLDRENPERLKDLNTIKSHIIHEVKHRFHGDVIGRNIHDENKYRARFRFLKTDADRTCCYIIMSSFDNPDSNTYKMKASVNNFFKSNLYSDQFKKIVVYLYYSDMDEFSARLHEFYQTTKNSDDFEEMLKKESSIEPLKSYKNMIDFKINYDQLSTIEKDKLRNIFDPKNVKKVEKYINQKGENFVKKVHKLWYFHQNPED